MAIIQPTSITEAAILQDLLDWIAARPSNEGWDAAFAGANGRTILELISGYGAFLSYQSRAARRESNALTAKLQSSIIALAYTLGYPINRRRAARLTVTLTNTNAADSGRPIALTRARHLGMSGTPPRPVSIMDTELPDLAPGQTTMVVCGVGTWETVKSSVDVGSFEEMDIPLASDRDVLDIDNNAVELVEVGMEGMDVPLTRYLELMNDDPVSAHVKTHVSSLVVLFGTSAFGYEVRSGFSTFDAHYLLLPTQSGSDSDTFGVFTPDQTQWPGLRVDRVVLRDRELPADDVAKIARLLPGYVAAKRRMVTAPDHQAIILSYPGILDAAVESGTCVSSDGEPLSEETIHSEALCTESGGTWRTHSVSEGCVNVVSYLRASTTDIGAPIRDSDGFPEKFSDQQEMNLERYLRDFQLRGSEIVFRPGIPVKVVVNLAYSTVSDDAFNEVQLQNFTNHVHMSVRSQCFRLGGTFDIARLQRDLVSHTLVKDVILQTPRNNRALSWVGYFDYTDDAVLTQLHHGDSPKPRHRRSNGCRVRNTSTSGEGSVQIQCIKTGGCIQSGVQARNSVRNPEQRLGRGATWLRSGTSADIEDDATMTIISENFARASLRGALDNARAGWPMLYVSLHTVLDTVSEANFIDDNNELQTDSHSGYSRQAIPAGYSPTDATAAVHVTTGTRDGVIGGADATYATPLYIGGNTDDPAGLDSTPAGYRASRVPHGVRTAADPTANPPRPAPVYSAILAGWAETDGVLSNRWKLRFTVSVSSTDVVRSYGVWTARTGNGAANFLFGANLSVPQLASRSGGTIPLERGTIVMSMSAG